MPGRSGKLAYLLCASLALLQTGDSDAQPNLDKRNQMGDTIWYPGVLRTDARFYVPEVLSLRVPKTQVPEVRLIKYNQPRTSSFVIREDGWGDQVQGGYLQAQLTVPPPPGMDGASCVPLVWRSVELWTAITPPKNSSSSYPASLQSVETFPLVNAEVDVLLDSLKKKNTEAIGVPVQFRCHFVYGGYHQLKAAQTYQVDLPLLTRAFAATTGGKKLLEVSPEQVSKFITACFDVGAVKPKPAAALDAQDAQAVFAGLRQKALSYHLALPNSDVPLNYETKLVLADISKAAPLDAGRLVAGFATAAPQAFEIALPEWAPLEVPAKLPALWLESGKLRFKAREVTFGGDGGPVGQSVVIQCALADRKEKKIKDLRLEVVYEEPKKKYEARSGSLTFPADKEELEWMCQVRYPAEGNMTYRLLAILEDGTFRKTDFQRIEVLTVPECYVRPNLPTLFPDDVPKTEKK